MGRSIIKEETGPYSRGDFLEKDERLQTDAEWHGAVLEDIESNQKTTNEYLENINENLRYLRDFLESRPLSPVTQNTIHPPMSLGRFVFAWIMAAAIIVIIVDLLKS